jgi:hypothetical protein
MLKYGMLRLDREKKAAFLKKIRASSGAIPTTLCIARTPGAAARAGAKNFVYAAAGMLRRQSPIKKSFCCFLFRNRNAYFPINPYSK